VPGTAGATTPSCTHGERFDDVTDDLEYVWPVTR
jgi:hypothetical protein